MEKQQENHRFPQWVEYLRKDIFIYSQKQFVEFLQESAENLNMRYVAGLENDAKTIRIDVLGQLLKCLGFNFDKITEFFGNARKVARCVRKLEDKLLESENDKKHPFHAFLKRRPTPENPKNADEILSVNWPKYIETLVYIPPEEFGKNRIIDMQSLNFFWTYAAIEYIIERRGRQSLTDKTKNAVQEVFNDSVKLLEQCKHVYIKLAQNIYQESMKEFDDVIAEMENMSNDNQFSEIKKKNVQLEYKTELRKARIFHCLIDIYNLFFERYGIKIVEDIKKSGNQAELNALANLMLEMVRSLRTYTITGKLSNPNQDKEIRILLGKNMLDIIYKVACDVERIMYLMRLMEV